MILELTSKESRHNLAGVDIVGVKGSKRYDLFISHAAADAAAVERRRAALAGPQRLSRELTLLRASAGKETQLHRRVELNLELKRLESCLAEAQEAL